jgi:hypothetical protein
MFWSNWSCKTWDVLLMGLVIGLPESLIRSCRIRSSYLLLVPNCRVALLFNLFKYHFLTLCIRYIRITFLYWWIITILYGVLLSAHVRSLSAQWIGCHIFIIYLRIVEFWPRLILAVPIERRLLSCLFILSNWNLLDFKTSVLIWITTTRGVLVCILERL